MRIEKKEKVDTMGYKIGETYLVDGYSESTVCILAQISNDKEMVLISLDSGNRYSRPVKVRDRSSITEDEVKAMAGGRPFRPVNAKVIVEWK